jgi:hypothetical protein
MSDAEYTDFFIDLQETFAQIKDWLNRYPFSFGLPAPYDIPDLYSSLAFT